VSTASHPRSRELRIERSIVSARTTTKARKIAALVLRVRTVLVDSSYSCVEKIPVEVGRSSTTIARPANSTPVSSPELPEKKNDSGLAFERNRVHSY